MSSFYDTILKRQNSSSPVVAGSFFWSLFGHSAPDCSVGFPNFFVEVEVDRIGREFSNKSRNSSTITMALPYNTGIRLTREKQNKQISIIRQHYFAMQNITVDAYLPAVACPHNFVPGYEAEYTYF